MDTKQAAKIFEALSYDIRLDLVRLLVRNAPHGLVQGDIAIRLNIRPNNLSFHLKAIVQSGLADAEREGRFIRYRANIQLLSEVIAFLTAECCSGQPEVCFPFLKSDLVRCCSTEKTKK
ncbi:MAG: ArsR family transcriptional regulator [Deltaproteobacteria bacterium]|jgi:DNA-binding transcriptional ArsR family regulator|nr:ArsR family transcriptional regulator [Deltaproteobacteria bacterium]